MLDDWWGERGATQQKKKHTKQRQRLYRWQGSFPNCKDRPVQITVTGRPEIEAGSSMT
jgi:hypothetical protein